MNISSEILSQAANPNRDALMEPPPDLFQKEEVKTKRPSLWNVVFYDDQFTTMEFVQFALRKVFHKSPEDALALTLAVHTQGKGIAGIYTFEVAEDKQSAVLLLAEIEEYPLKVEVERG